MNSSLAVNPNLSILVLVAAAAANSAADTASGVWSWISSNVGPIATIILMASAMSRYLEKRQNDRITNSEKKVLEYIDNKLQIIVNDMHSMKQTDDMIVRYIREDLQDLKDEIVRLRDHNYSKPDYSIRNRRRQEDQDKKNNKNGT